MSPGPLEFLQEPDRLRVALSPMRRQLLDRLQEPASATEVAAELGISRQRINYHMRALEQAGLIELVKERRRRGFVERIFGLTAQAFVVDPAVMGGGSAPAEQDRFASERLVGLAAEVVGDVARMESRAKGRGGRVPTFAIETEVNLMGPVDVRHFQAALAQVVAGAVAEFDAPTAGKRYRVIVGGYPIG
jgi:DNA-binding transcriptional ArsR family regulator